MSYISDYDYKILKFIYDSKAPVTEKMILRKFHNLGLAVTKDMISRKLLTLDFVGDSILDRNDDSPLKLTSSGLSAYQSYKHDDRLKGWAVWKERLYGALIALALDLIREFLFPGFTDWITDLIKSFQK